MQIFSKIFFTKNERFYGTLTLKFDSKLFRLFRYFSVQISPQHFISEQ